MEKIPKRFWDDMNWGRKNYPILTKKYPDQWVAIFKHWVVAADEDPGKVEDEAKARIKEEHIPMMFIECGAHIYNEVQGFAGKI